MEARIKEKQEVAKGTLLVTFDLLGEEVDFKPGQYFFVTLPDIGHQDDKGLRRHITRGDVAEREGRPRPRDTNARQRLQADARRASSWRGSGRRAAEGELRPARSDRPAVRVHRRRDRHHRLSQHAPLHPRGAAPLPRDADLLEPRPRVDGVPRRAPRARADASRLPAHPHDDQDPGWDGETRKIDAQFVKDYLEPDLDQYTFLVAGPPAMTEGVQKALEEAGVDEENVTPEGYSGY